MIKQIEEAIENLSIEVSTGCRDIAILEAALTALQKIASGNDWFPIESARKDKPIWGYCKNFDQQYLMKWNRETSFFKEGWYHCTMVAGGYGLGNDTIIPFKDEQPTHWKPLDGATHIKMLMEREIEDD